jgi:hypothetical protein
MGGDGRSAWTRRWKDLVEMHSADCGGIGRISEARLSLCRRAAILEVALEQQEAKMSEGHGTCQRQTAKPLMRS